MYPGLSEFRDLFMGSSKAYAFFKVSGVDTSGKATGNYCVKRQEATIEVWHKHLNGQEGLVVIPLNEEAKVRWGAIDVDRYHMPKADVVALIRQIREKKLPLVPCRSKSGGMHLFLFLKDWLPAKFVREKVQQWASHIGCGQCEIFPKQVTVDPSRDEVGSCLNLPYFGNDKTERYAYNDAGSPLGLRDFLVVANEYRQDFQSLIPIVGVSGEAILDAPPCISRLFAQGFPEGARNNCLGQCATYLKKKYGENWGSQLHMINRRNGCVGDESADNPNRLTDVEVNGVIKSYSKKDYRYKCDEEPFKSNCDRATCRTRKFGIGIEGNGFPQSGTLMKHEQDPPHWEVIVEGSDKRIHLQTDDLFEFRRFQKAVLEQATIVVSPMLKTQEWQLVLTGLIQEVILVEHDKSTTVESKLLYYLEEFCTSRVQAHSQEEIILGKPWTHNGLHYFQLIDFERYLERVKFKDLPRNAIIRILKDTCKAQTHRVRFSKGAQRPVVVIPQFHSIDPNIGIPEAINPNEVI